MYTDVQYGRAESGGTAGTSAQIYKRNTNYWVYILSTEYVSDGREIQDIQDMPSLQSDWGSAGDTTVIVRSMQCPTSTPTSLRPRASRMGCEDAVERRRPARRGDREVASWYHDCRAKSETTQPRIHGEYPLRCASLKWTPRGTWEGWRDEV